MDIKSLIEKLKKESLSNAEADQLLEWMNDGNWEDATDNLEVKQQIWSKIEARREKRPVFRMHAWKWAAAGMVGLLLSAGWWYSQHSAPKQATAFKEASAQNIKRLELPDGSLVFLMPNSNLTYDADFGPGKRIVHLEGSASFEVEADANNPFIVKAGTMQAVALGTSFSVIAPQAGKDFQVKLSHGAVQVQSEGYQAQKLLPGEMIIVTDKTKDLIVEKTAALFKSSVLYFKEAGYEEVLNKLKTYYGIREIIEEGINNKNWKITGEFHHEPIELVLENIAFACDLTYRIDRDILYLKSNK
jgi:transmembrane sensor